MNDPENVAVLAKNLSVSYKMTSGRTLSVFGGITFTLSAKTFTSIVGASGCGKTTLLQSLAGLLKPTAGTVSLAGSTPETARAEHKIAFVFQKPVFFDWLSLFQNVVLPARLAHAGEYFDRVPYFLRVFGLENYSTAYPHELSGGMLSRAALARALASNPEYLFLDEAFGNLDEVMREDLYGALQAETKRTGATVVSVTHSISEALMLSDEILLFSGRTQAQVQKLTIASPRPRTAEFRRSQEFREMTDFIRMRLRGQPE